MSFVDSRLTRICISPSLDLAEARSKITKLEESIATLEQQLWEAGVSITFGRTVPRTGFPSSSSTPSGPSQILHMQANPASEHFALRRQELDRLKEENSALVKRVGELERGVLGAGAEEGGLIPRKTWENICIEKAELTNTVSQKELRLLRLQQVRLLYANQRAVSLMGYLTSTQVFRAKAVEFRDVTSSILGWKLMFGASSVRLTSAFDQTASMVFDSVSTSKKDTGTMKLISLGDGGEGGPAKTKDLMEYWVHQKKSIPCFLAALTLACFGESEVKGHK